MAGEVPEPAAEGKLKLLVCCFGNIECSHGEGRGRVTVGIVPRRIRFCVRGLLKRFRVAREVVGP